MKKIIILLLSISLSSCAQKVTFDEEGLNETFTSLNGDAIPFKTILEKHKGKTIFIDVWASWCSDCIKDMPKVKELQTEENDVVYLKLSLDKNINAWKNGIEKFKVKGEHYLIDKGWKPSKFCNSIDLNWIPRYMVIGKDGEIKMYKATKITDKAIKRTIKADK